MTLDHDLKQFLASLPQRRLLVAGEIGIDEYLWGDVNRISPEAPVPVIEVDHTTLKLGLAANVAQNVASLGAQTTLVSIRGKDADGTRIERLLEQAGIKNTILITDESRPTPRKVRILAGKQHVARVDYEKTHRLTEDVGDQFRSAICDSLDSVDGVIVQDYGKGLWTPEILSFVAEARKKKKPVFVDPSRLSPLSLYKDVTLLSPNLHEAATLTKRTGSLAELSGDDKVALQSISSKILETTGSDHVIVTCGRSGMVALSRGKNELLSIPTYARDVFDVTGAGDTVIAVLALAHVSGLSLTDCMRTANAAAGVVVGRVGTSTVTQEELREAIELIAGAQASLPELSQ